MHYSLFEYKPSIKRDVREDIRSDGARSFFFLIINSGTTNSGRREKLNNNG